LIGDIPPKNSGAFVSFGVIAGEVACKNGLASAGSPQGTQPDRMLIVIWRRNFNEQKSAAYDFVPRRAGSAGRTLDIRGNTRVWKEAIRWLWRSTG
jgi:hypothetical protein